MVVSCTNELQVDQIFCGFPSWLAAATEFFCLCCVLYLAKILLQQTSMRMRRAWVVRRRVSSVLFPGVSGYECNCGYQCRLDCSHSYRSS